jgi:hypothetical protein
VQLHNVDVIKLLPPLVISEADGHPASEAGNAETYWPKIIHPQRVMESGWVFTTREFDQQRWPFIGKSPHVTPQNS